MLRARMSLRGINLNLLPILRALLQERNVSRAAASVGISQPAASRALSQLRMILADPLLVRSGQTLILTPRAEALKDHVDQICLGIASVWEPALFDPRTAQREFVIAAADYAPILMVPKLATYLEASAPGISLRFNEWRSADVPETQRSIDFVIGPLTVVNPIVADGGSSIVLFDDEFVTVVSASHPLAGQSPDAAEIDRFPHILFAAGDDGQRVSAVNMMMDRRRVRLLATVGQFAALPFLALMTGSVTVMPRRLAKIMQKELPVVIVKEPRPRARVRVHLAWSRRLDADPAHRWFRKIVIDTFAGEGIHG